MSQSDPLVACGNKLRRGPLGYGPAAADAVNGQPTECSRITMLNSAGNNKYHRPTITAGPCSTKVEMQDQDCNLQVSE